ncbi:DUF3592 domain-containing protein [Marinagarivorans cellulosilyticus]|nr:DUF3592 domain-containing protein [Marinagarivorans cellulosilyticus]
MPIGIIIILSVMYYGLHIYMIVLGLLLCSAFIVGTWDLCAQRKKLAFERDPENVKSPNLFDVEDMESMFDHSHYPDFPVTGYISAIVFFAVGLGLFFHPGLAMMGFEGQIKAKSWPTVEGVVVHSRVLEHPIPSTNRPYKAELLFRYEVDGKSYNLDEPYRGQSLSWRDNMSAYKERSRYKTGAPVTIHYEPGNPYNATIEVKLSMWSIVQFWILAFCIYLGFTFLAGSTQQTWRFIQSRKDR